MDHKKWIIFFLFNISTYALQPFLCFSVKSKQKIDHVKQTRLLAVPAQFS